MRPEACPDQDRTLARDRPRQALAISGTGGGLPGSCDDPRRGRSRQASGPLWRPGRGGAGGGGQDPTALPAGGASRMKLSERFDRRYQQTPLATPVMPVPPSPNGPPLAPPASAPTAVAAPSAAAPVEVAALVT